MATRQPILATRRISTRDLGRLVDRMQEIHAEEVAVGWTQNSTAKYPNSSTGINTASVALIHEFGLGHQTPKHFLRDSIRAFSNNTTLIKNAATVAVAGHPARALALLGAGAAQEVQDTVRGIGLIDTGLLRQSISWQVASR